MKSPIRNNEICPKCNDEFSLSNLNRHIVACERRWKPSVNVDTMSTSDGWRCDQCSNLYPSRKHLAAHYWRKHTERGLQHDPNLDRVAWNKGLSKETDARVAANIAATTESLRKLRATGWKPPPPGLAARQATSKRQSLKNSGGKCKWFVVEGQNVQGTWERNIAQKLTELGIRWEKLKTNRDILEYELDGISHSYTPDFYLPDSNVYLEIKGYWWGRDKEKMNEIFAKYPHLKIVIIEKDDYKKILRGELVW